MAARPSDHDTAAGAADALDTIGRWHPDFASDVLAAMDASGVDCTDTQRFCDWVAANGDIAYPMVPFGRAVLTRRTDGTTTTVWVEVGSNRFRVIDRGIGTVDVAPLASDGNPRDELTRTVPGRLADGIALGTRRRTRAG